MEDVKRPARESGANRFGGPDLSVPEDVKFLDTLELTGLADAFYRPGLSGPVDPIGGRVPAIGCA